MGDVNSGLDDTGINSRSTAGFNGGYVQAYLENAKYPSAKEELIMYARKRNAPDEFIDKISSIPDKSYNNWEEVYKEF